VQVVVVPILKGADAAALEAAVARISDELPPVARLAVDWRQDRTPGYKFNEWELKGVPVRLEIGPRDLATGQAVLVRRDTRAKQAVPIAGLAPAVATTLDAIQDDLLAAAGRTLAERVRPVASRAELAERAAANAGWSLAHWCGDAACEATVKAETKATIRCLPFDAAEDRGRCIVCGGASERRAIFARAY
jgi:prolyl-tRNA synthetase